MLIVTEDRRREGVGTALVNEAEERLRKKGCTRIEIANEIELRNATAFLRSVGFEDRAHLEMKAVKKT